MDPTAPGGSLSAENPPVVESPENRVTESTFRAAWWCRNPHLQTLYPTLFRVFPRPDYRRERIELPDGDFLDLDWFGPEDFGTVVLLLHGLEGSSSSQYIRGLAAILEKQGIRTVTMHFRGCSGEINRSTRSYHAGEIGDLSFVSQLIRDRFPDSRISAVGYSLGGNVLLNYLATVRDNPFWSALTVSVPFLLENCARRLQHGLSRIYQYKLVRQMQGSIRRKARRMEVPINLKRLENCSNFYEFDDLVTATLHGFANVEDYYRRCSSLRAIKNIATPTLLIQALDDPFLDLDSIPKVSDLSPAVRLEWSRHGGHCGFISGSIPFYPDYWLEKRISKFIRSV